MTADPHARQDRSRHFHSSSSSSSKASDPVLVECLCMTRQNIAYHNTVIEAAFTAAAAVAAAVALKCNGKAKANRSYL